MKNTIDISWTHSVIISLKIAVYVSRTVVEKKEKKPGTWVAFQVVPMLCNVIELSRK